MLKGYESDLRDTLSRVHLPVQNAKHDHSVGRDTVIDDMVLDAIGAEARGNLVS